MARSSDLDPILSRLKRYQNVRLERGQEAVRVPATRSEGFDIGVELLAGTFTVAFESWRREVDDVETAWNLIALGLSTGSRLRIEPLPDGRSACWLEIILPDGSWRTLPELGREPNRLNAAVRYRQNDYVRAAYGSANATRSPDSLRQAS